MDSIGQTLKAARESKNMELQDVTAATLMQPHVISAIENDDFAAMPAPVYARGFIRLYAESMGLDPAPFINAYNNRSRPVASPPKRTSAREQPSTPDARPPAHTAPQKPPLSKPPAPQPPAPRPLAGEPVQEPRPVDKRPRPIRFRMPRLPEFPRFGFSLGAAKRRLSASIARIKKAFLRVRMPRIDAAGIISPLRSGAKAIIRIIGRISLPCPSISSETAVLLFRSALAILFLLLAVAGMLWYSDSRRPRIFHSRLIQEPPEPYVEFRPVKQ